MSVYLSACLSVCLSVCLFVCACSEPNVVCKLFFWLAQQCNFLFVYIKLRNAIFASSAVPLAVLEDMEEHEKEFSPHMETGPELPFLESDCKYTPIFGFAFRYICRWWNALDSEQKAAQNEKLQTEWCPIDTWCINPQLRSAFKFMDCHEQALAKEAAEEARLQREEEEGRALWRKQQQEKREWLARMVLKENSKRPAKQVLRNMCQAELDKRYDQAMAAAATRQATRNAAQQAKKRALAESKGKGKGKSQHQQAKPMVACPEGIQTFEETDKKEKSKKHDSKEGKKARGVKEKSKKEKNKKEKSKKEKSKKEKSKKGESKNHSSISTNEYEDQPSASGTWV